MQSETKKSIDGLSHQNKSKKRVVDLSSAKRLRLDSARNSNAMHNTISYTCATESMNMSSAKLSENQNIAPIENNIK